MKENENWCVDFFDDLFAEHHLVRGDEDGLRRTVGFLEDRLRLKPRDRVFDQCCGVGSLGIALAERGYLVSGVDLIASYVERARRDAGSLASRCLFTTGDAHSYVAPAPCDAALNWWTSFGYTPDDARNIKMLQCVSKSLRTGGWFALDYMNAPQRLKEFEGKEYSVSKVERKGCTVLWESRLDRARGMVVKKWSYAGADGKEVERQGGGAKLYSRADLEKMLEDSGFGDIEFYGSVAGEPLSDSSPRCIAVARKV